MDSGRFGSRKKTKPRQFVRPLALFSRQEACERLGQRALLGRSYMRLPRERSTDPGGEVCPGPIAGSHSTASAAGTSPAMGAGQRPVLLMRLARGAPLPAGDPAACHSPHSRHSSSPGLPTLCQARLCSVPARRAREPQRCGGAAAHPRRRPRADGHRGMSSAGPTHPRSLPRHVPTGEGRPGAAHRAGTLQN